MSPHALNLSPRDNLCSTLMTPESFISILSMSVIREQIGKNIKYVFTCNGKPVAKANNHAWRNALKRTGIEDFRWHVLRHTWATWHVQKRNTFVCATRLGG